MNRLPAQIEPVPQHLHRKENNMDQVKNIGWRVTFAGLGINLALGILYTWSIFKESIKESIVAGDGRFDWSLAALNDPYAVCCLVFAFAMILAGRVQDKTGPKMTAILGGVLTGSGLILIAFSTSWIVWILGFGVLTGAGLGFGYASATPPAIKWFPPAKTGMIAGIVVALMAVGNASGRIIAGIVSDRIGRANTLFIMLSFQAVIIFSLMFIAPGQVILLVMAATFIGFNYGTNLSLFPSVTKDFFGLKNFGVNYGLVFSAWGVGGFIFPRVSQMIVAYTGTPKMAYILAAALLMTGAVLALMTRAPETETQPPAMGIPGPVPGKN
jgi:MFS family permease